MRGLYLVLHFAGLIRLATTVIGATGIAGLVAGFAFRDILENYLASILISLRNPFRLGDVVDIGGHLGVVQRVTSRGTVLMDAADTGLAGIRAGRLLVEDARLRGDEPPGGGSADARLHVDAGNRAWPHSPPRMCLPSV